jgi:hypothetical protein
VGKNWAVLKREIEKTPPNTLNWKMITGKKPGSFFQKGN